MKKLTTLFFGAVMFSSCSHYYYVPNTQNVPLFREKYEYRLSAFYGGGDESSCGEIQTAYSASEHLGLMANFMFAKGGSSTDADYAKGYCLEGAAGYFKPFGNQQVFEIYGGLGGGSQNHEYYNFDQSEGKANLSFIKVFVQPSIGMTFNAFDIAFSTRMTSMSFPNINNNGVIANYEYERLQSIEDNGHFFIEPAITLRAGWKNVKFQLQGQISKDLSNSTFYIGEEYHISGGLYFTIANRYKSGKTNNNQ